MPRGCAKNRDEKSRAKTLKQSKRRRRQEAKKRDVVAHIIFNHPFEQGPCIDKDELRSVCVAFEYVLL